MPVDLQAIRHDLLRKIGGYPLTIAGSTSTTLTVPELRYRFDQSKIQRWRLHIPGNPAGNALRFVNEYNPEAGELTVDAFDAGSTPQANAVIELTPLGDPDPEELNTTINRVLQKTRRSVISFIPTVLGQRDYPLIRYPWIIGAADVMLVRLRHSPNLVDNETFDVWGDGKQNIPPRWVLSGAGATITRRKGIDEGRAALLARTSADAMLRQSLGTLHGQLRGKQVTASVDVWCSAANRARISLRDESGQNIVRSGFHDGDSRWQQLVVSGYTVNEERDGLEIALEVSGAAAEATFTNVFVVEGESVHSNLIKYGSYSYDARPIKHRIINVATPMVYLKEEPGRQAQLMITSTQRFTPLGAEDEETDCEREAVVAGTIAELSRRRAAGEDQTRWQDLERIYTPIYTDWQRRLVPNPAQDIANTTVVVMPG